jgi:hypothetical protein
MNNQEIFKSILDTHNTTKEVLISLVKEKIKLVGGDLNIIHCSPQINIPIISIDNCRVINAELDTIFLNQNNEIELTAHEIIITDEEITHLEYNSLKSFGDKPDFQIKDITFIDWVSIYNCEALNGY